MKSLEIIILSEMIDSFFPFVSLSSEERSTLLSSSSLQPQVEGILLEEGEWIHNSKSHQESLKGSSSSCDFGSMELETIEDSRLHQEPLKGNERSDFPDSMELEKDDWDRDEDFRKIEDFNSESSSDTGPDEDDIWNLKFFVQYPQRDNVPLSLTRLELKQLRRLMLSLLGSDGELSDLADWPKRLLNILDLNLVEDKILWTPIELLAIGFYISSRGSLIMPMRPRMTSFRFSLRSQPTSSLPESPQGSEEGDDEDDSTKLGSKCIAFTYSLVSCPFLTFHNTYLKPTIIPVNKRNANLQDIFFICKDLLRFQGRYLILWEECMSFENEKCIIRSLDLDNTDCWHRFIANLTEFFHVTHFQPLQDQIYSSKRSQDRNIMKISASLDRESNLVCYLIKKLPKGRLERNKTNHKDDPKSKRSYRKKAKYWKDRKNPILQEIIEYSKELMARQKKPGWENFLNF